jgi:hypothetical protein
MAALIAGSFAQCRIYSKYLALQIKACGRTCSANPSRFDTMPSRPSLQA